MFIILNNKIYLIFFALKKITCTENFESLNFSLKTLLS